MLENIMDCNTVNCNVDGFEKSKYSDEFKEF